MIRIDSPVMLELKDQQASVEERPGAKPRAGAPKKGNEITKRERIAENATLAATYGLTPALIEDLRGVFAKSGASDFTTWLGTQLRPVSATVSAEKNVLIAERLLAKETPSLQDRVGLDPFGTQADATKTTSAVAYKGAELALGKPKDGPLAQAFTDVTPARDGSLATALADFRTLPEEVQDQADSVTVSLITDTFGPILTAADLFEPEEPKPAVTLRPLPVLDKDTVDGVLAAIEAMRPEVVPFVPPPTPDAPTLPPVTVPPLVLSKIEQQLLSVANGLASGINLKTLDIESALQWVMLQSMREATIDLRAMLEDMRELHKRKRAERERIATMKKDRSRVEAEMFDEYDALRKNGAILENVTFDEYKRWRPLALDEAGHPQLRKDVPLPSVFTTPGSTEAAGVAATVPAEAEAYCLTEADARYLHAYYEHLAPATSFADFLREQGFVAAENGGTPEASAAKAQDIVAALTARGADAKALHDTGGVSAAQSAQNLARMTEMLTRLSILEALAPLNPSLQVELESARREVSTVMARPLSAEDREALAAWQADPARRGELSQLGAYFTQLSAFAQQKVAKGIDALERSLKAGGASDSYIKDRSVSFDADGVHVRYQVNDYEWDDQRKPVTETFLAGGAWTIATHTDTSVKKVIEGAPGFEAAGPLGDELRALLAKPGVTAFTLDFGGEDQLAAMGSALANASLAAASYAGVGAESVESFEGSFASEWAAARDGSALVARRQTASPEERPGVLPSGATDTLVATQFGLAQYGAAIDSAQADFDALADLAEEQQLRLQRLMEMRQQAVSMCSNVMKKFSETAGQIIQNLK